MAEPLTDKTMGVPSLWRITAGVEAAGGVLWSQPEVALSARTFHGGTSAEGYPDFIFSSGGGT